MIRAGLILAVLASPATAQQVAGAEGAVVCARIIVVTIIDIIIAMRKYINPQD